MFEIARPWALRLLLGICSLLVGACAAGEIAFSSDDADADLADEVEDPETPEGIDDAADAPIDEEEPEEDSEAEDDLDSQSEEILQIAGPPGQLRAGCTAKGSLGGHTVWLHFTRPNDRCSPNAANESGVDAHILAELIRLIDSVPAGGRIDAHIFSITVNAVGAALLRAQQRGVDVWVSTDKRVGKSSDSVRSKYLDKIAHRNYCGDSTRGSCIGAKSGSISHTKLFVFSTAVAPDGAVHNNVAWFSSANQTRSSGMQSFNNTATVYGDATLYSKLRGYLDDLFFERRKSNYYDAASGRGYMMAAAADVYASPDLDTDLIVNRINDITPNSDCQVRVMQASVRDSRMKIVNHLISMKKKGCKVYVVSHNIEPNARAALKAAKIPLRKQRVHDKAFVVRGRYAGKLRYRVYTGSHNLSISANTKYDEIFVKLAPETENNRPVYNAYRRHFDDAYSTGSKW